MAKRGFSLLELIIAVFLVTVVLFPLLQELASVVAASAGSEAEVTALNLAEAKLEGELNTTYSSVTAETKAVVTNFSKYKRQVTVATPLTNLKKVGVVVFWTPSGGTERSLSLETYVTNY